MTNLIKAEGLSRASASDPRGKTHRAPLQEEDTSLAFILIA